MCFLVDAEVKPEHVATEPNVNSTVTIPNVTINATEAVPAVDNSWFQFSNYPAMLEVYKNPKNSNSNVHLAVVLPSGSTNAILKLSPEGDSVTIKFQWSKTLFNMDELFRKQLQSKELTLCYPRVTSFLDGLSKCRIKIDDAPECAMHIKLPIKVQVSPESWNKWGLQSTDGSTIIAANFQGIVTNYMVTSAEEKVDFLK